MRNRASLERGFGAAETALVVIVLAVIIAVAVNRYTGDIREARETAVRAELASLRNTINLFGAIRGRCPETLRELIAAEFAIPYQAGPFELKKDAELGIKVEEKIVFRTEYLEAYALDGEGNILDPFGSPYNYDRSKCTVHSGTAGYESY